MRAKRSSKSPRQKNCKILDVVFMQRRVVLSSVARGGAGGGGAIAPIGMSTKMQNEKNTTFLALLRLFYVLEWTK